MTVSQLPLEHLHRIQTAIGELDSEPDEGSVAKTIKQELPLLNGPQTLAVVDEVLKNTRGFGLLDELLSRENVTDVLVNGHDDIWFDQGFGLEKANLRWSSDAEVREFAVRLAHQMFRRLDEVQPFVDVRLNGGIRMHAIIPPLAGDKTCISFRKPSEKTLSLEELFNREMFDAQMYEALTKIVQAGVSFLICGGTGSGKTTLLRALLQTVPAVQRLVIVEDLYELDVAHPHAINLQTRQPNVEGIGEVSLHTLVRQALRMRPDRLVVGEIRGTEIIELFNALNTGHKGGCATIHANSATDVPARVETLGLMAGLPLEAIRSLLVCAVDFVIELKTTAQHQRKVTSIKKLQFQNGGIQAVPCSTELLHVESSKPQFVLQQ